MLKLNKKVEVNFNKIFGKIIGYGILHRTNANPVYLVELDEGFYDPDNKLFVSTIIVTEDNLKEAENFK